MTGKCFAVLLGALVINCVVIAQNNENEKTPILSLVEKSYDFGTIGENDGYAEHTFKFSNTGSAPLVINRITASCGCTQPEWSHAPVEPGKEGFIIITFNPKGRIGPFHKTATVYTNENDGFTRHNLVITGQVVEKPRDPGGVVFQDTIGGIGIEKKKMEFKTFNASASNQLKTYIKNYHSETVYFVWENVPDYLAVTAPDSLKADWPGEIIFTIDGLKTAEKRGRITEYCTWIIKNKDGQQLGQDQFSLTVNYLDDFKKLSPVQSVSAPVLEIKNTIVDFGKIKKGLFGGKVSKPILLTNTGKSDLIIHSVTCDEKRIYLPDIKGKTIKVGESFTIQPFIKAKEVISENIDTEVYVVCNDPKGPVRRIKVTAAKIN